MPPRHEETSTLPRSRFDDSAAARASFVLLVTQGPDRGARFVLDGSRATRALIGQSAVCDLRLGDRQVSRRHATVDLTPRGLRLTDLGSTNGTTVNGVSISEVYLRGGEVVRLGETTLHVEQAVVPNASALTSDMRFGRVIGMSPEMRRLYPLCQRLAASEIPIVIEGETGTGKELMAEALHDAGRRAGAPFVVFDCTTVPASSVEPVLFGDARPGRTPTQGLFHEAEGGTLFIDEIADLDLAMQAKLGRAIERFEIQPVGANRWIRVDTRVIAATQRNLDREVQAGRFREDLFYRLGQGLIQLPPLRDRTGDIGVLTRHFWRALGGGDQDMPAGIVEKLEDHSWPGNVRELANAIARAIALGDVATPDAAESPVAPERAAPTVDRIIESAIDSGLPLPRARDQVIAEFDRRYVTRLLERYDGSVTRAAAASGLARRYFQVLKARYAKG